ncbi:hypothetical protein DQ04_01171080 [Trypanosoma grayi]|uniref:hypothetical protein n=1 Tax=Trypanosoma grayi TaxID=71804 RepID=UPI0004F42D8A|nr:hypothetical protein DQ04_01171080 [Trypanosoma grayi]KEG13175.1 hypothetical protein DQ04_01171080 [Trypanosoma grayi]
MSEVRPNIYSDTPLRKAEMGPPGIAVVTGVLASIVLLLVAVYLIHHCFCKEDRKAPVDQRQRRPDSFHNTRELQAVRLDGSEDDDDNSNSATESNAVELNCWRHTFDSLMCDDHKRTRNSAALHAILCVPLDLQLCDPLENADLAADENRLIRARERRRVLSSVLPLPGGSGSGSLADANNNLAARSHSWHRDPYSEGAWLADPSRQRGSHSRLCVGPTSHVRPPGELSVDADAVMDALLSSNDHRVPRE